MTGLASNSCSEGPKDVTEEIRKANIDFTEAFNSNDAERLANVYTKDGSLLPPNSEPVNGRENIIKFWQGVFEMGINRGELKTIKAMAMGDMAVEEGRFTIYAGDQKVDNGNYIVIWKKVNGQWKYHRDIWNSSNPAQ